MVISVNDPVLQFKQTLERRIANGTTKSRLERITERAVEIFTKYRDSQVYDLFPLLSKFRFTSDQKRSLHAAITGAAEESPQVERLLELEIPFRNYAKQYTLKFADGEIQVSKAELFAYGDYFKTFLDSKINRRLREIDLSEIIRAVKISRIAKLIGLKTVNTEPMPLEKETFKTIIAFLRDEVELDFDDQDTDETIQAISGYFQIKDLEKRYYNTIDQAIAFAKEFNAQEIDLARCKGELTDHHLDQILSLPSLRKTEKVLDLKALFPKLSVIDESVWKTHVDMAKYGLKVDTAVDQRVAIKNLHDMFRRLKIEGGAGITLLTMPEGLSVNKLGEIAFHPLRGYAMKGCAVAWDVTASPYPNRDAHILKSYTIAVTNSVLCQSRNRTPYVQRKLVEKEGCRLGSFLDLMALNLLTYMIGPKTRLYGDNPSTFWLASEKRFGRHVMVGGFDKYTFRVRRCWKYTYDCIGVAAARKFN